MMSLAVITTACKKNEDSPAVQPVSTEVLIYKKTFGGEGVGMDDVHLIGDLYLAYYNEVLYLNDAFNNRIKRLDADFKTVEWIGFKDGIWGIYTGDAQEGGLPFDQIFIRNSVMYIETYYSFTGLNLKLVEINGGALLSDTIFDEYPPGKTDFQSMGMDSKESWYIEYSNNFSDYVIRKVDKNLIMDADYEIKFNGSLAEIVFDDEDNLYLLDISQNGLEKEIRKYNSSGKLIKKWEVNSAIYLDIYNDKIYLVATGEEHGGVWGSWLKQYSLEGKLLRIFTLDQWSNDDMVMGSMGDFKVVKDAVIFSTDDQNKLAVFSMTNQ